MDKEKKPIIIETADIYLHFPYIMKEEADDLADFLEEEHIEYEGATDIFIGLQQQCKKQKEVIDKVEELLIIKKTRCLNEDDYILNVPDLDDILHLVKEASE